LVLLVVVVVVAVMLSLVGTAPAAKARPAGVSFVLLSGRHAGEQVKTDGGPNVPARLNGGRISGRLIPQSEGNEFTFKGTVRARGRARARAADNTDAAALPKATLPGFLRALYNAHGREVAAAIALSEKGVTPNFKQIQLDLTQEIGRFDALRDAQEITAQQHDDWVLKLNKAKDGDTAAAKNLDDAGKAPGPKTRARLIKKALDELQNAAGVKSDLIDAIYATAPTEALIAAEPPPTPVTNPPTPVPTLDEAPSIPPDEVFGLTASNSNSTQFVGTLNPGTPNERLFVVDAFGHIVSFGPPASAGFAFGPMDAVGGMFQGGPAFESPPFFSDKQPTPLAMGNGATGGAVRGGDTKWFVGFVSLARQPFERAAAWLARTVSGSHARASRLSFTGFRVGGFAGGSSLFTVSGDLAFGDHFDRGTSGPFRAFRIDLRSGRLAELFRPRGGSSQPKASDRAGLAAGGSVFSSGAVQATYWWGAQHYLRFPTSPGVNTDIYGMNDAGVGVGLVGRPGDYHAALFEHGKVYDLNTLIPPGSGWTLTKANAISNTGVIVGAGILNGQQRGFILNLSSARH
jgi:hypothetical protein